MPITHDVDQMYRVLALNARARQATTEEEHEGYKELWQLANFCYFDRNRFVWGFDIEKVEI